jgi:hypothetical protein
MRVLVRSEPPIFNAVRLVLARGGAADFAVVTALTNNVDIASATLRVVERAASEKDSLLDVLERARFPAHVILLLDMYVLVTPLHGGCTLMCR